MKKLIAMISCLVILGSVFYANESDNKKQITLVGNYCALSSKAVAGEIKKPFKASKIKEVNMKEITDIFPRGGANTAYAKYFTGNSYLNILSKDGVIIGNVTFEPGCRNNWHTHQAAKGVGQILLCTAGRGWYQEWGKPAQELRAGDVVNIPAGVKHWHGAAKNSWFSHLAVEVPGENTKTDWHEPLSNGEYEKLP